MTNKFTQLDVAVIDDFFQTIGTEDFIWQEHPLLQSTRCLRMDVGIRKVYEEGRVDVKEEMKLEVKHEYGALNQ